MEAFLHAGNKAETVILVDIQMSAVKSAVNNIIRIVDDGVVVQGWHTNLCSTTHILDGIDFLEANPPWSWSKAITGLGFLHLLARTLSKGSGRGLLATATNAVGSVLGLLQNYQLEG